MKAKDKPKKNIGIIRRILIGKVFNFGNYQKSTRFVIVGVTRDRNSHGIPEVLIGRVYGGNTYTQIQIMSWYQYYRSEINFIGRHTREEIRKCLKSNPNKVKYHVGQWIDITKSNVKIYDNHDLYKEYLKTL